MIGLTILGLFEFTGGVDLTVLGMPGCSLYTTLDATEAFLPAGGVGSTSFAIPLNPALAGMVMLSQSAVSVPGINPFGFVTSNGVQLILDLP